MSITTTLVGGNSAVCLPPGEYYVGDPCYGVEDHARWLRQLQSVYGRDLHGYTGPDPFGGPYGTIAKDPDGPKWWAGHGTAHGDGVYFDQHGREYGVDAGLLGVVPAELAEDSALWVRRSAIWFALSGLWPFAPLDLHGQPGPISPIEMVDYTIHFVALAVLAADLWLTITTKRNAS